MTPTASVSPMSIAELMTVDSLLPLRSISSTTPCTPCTPCTSPPDRPWNSMVAADGRILKLFSSDLQPRISIRLCNFRPCNVAGGNKNKTKSSSFLVTGIPGQEEKKTRRRNRNVLSTLPSHLPMEIFFRIIIIIIIIINKLYRPG